MTTDELLDLCLKVLQENDRGKHTVPAKGLYPHQWLWDSCFIAIGQRHYNTKRAQQEILSLLKGQWSNGMIPNMVLTPSNIPSQAEVFWRSEISPFSPDDVATSGITQPPMLAEAVVRIGQKLPKAERIIWYQRVYPALIHFHQWLYNERDPNNSGLVLQIHPWETGLDNTPPWIYELQKHKTPLWIKLVGLLKIDNLIGPLRKDSFLALPGERISTLNALSYYSIQRRLRRNRYATKNILKCNELTIEDVNYNAVLVRANFQLQKIAKQINQPLPTDLAESIKKSESALEELWDAYSGQYYSRNHNTNKLIKVSSIGTLLPLYAGSITKERAKHLVEILNNEQSFGTNYPVPTVPKNTKWFDQHKYWQGPTWVNTNWLIIDGLKRYGFTKEAEHIKQQTIKMVAGSGIREYFSPLDASPAGAHNFSWTASLIIDLLNS